LANIKSQIKRNKQAEAARERNKAIKTALKTEVKKFNASLEVSVEEAAVSLKAVTVALDKAASDGVIHNNEASRKKSTAAKKYNAVVANPPAPKVEEEKKPKAAKAAPKKPAAKKPAAKKPAVKKAAAKK
jgi:small subunit ribosomal protein S20